MKLTIHDDPELLAERFRALKKLKNTALKVGLPESAGGRLHFILAVQEHGSPLMHIPARPVIRPALSRDETRSAMASAMKDAVRAAWEGGRSQEKPGGSRSGRRRRHPGVYRFPYPAAQQPADRGRRLDMEPEGPESGLCEGQGIQ